ncbi:MAG: hypothetical protein R2939_06790 [Kofleriaceae bacterium]
MLEVELRTCPRSRPLRDGAIDHALVVVAFAHLSLARRRHRCRSPR